MTTRQKLTKSAIFQFLQKSIVKQADAGITTVFGPVSVSGYIPACNRSIFADSKIFFSNIFQNKYIMNKITRVG